MRLDWMKGQKGTSGHTGGLRSTDFLSSWCVWLTVLNGSIFLMYTILFQTMFNPNDLIVLNFDCFLNVYLLTYREISR